MPVLWAVRNGIVFVTLMGDYAFHEIRDAIATAYADLRAPARAPLLIDGRSSLVYLLPEKIQLRSDWYRDVLERGIRARCAMVVGESEYRQQIVAQGIAPLQEAGVPVRSFAQFADALAWLRAPGVRSIHSSTDQPVATARCHSGCLRSVVKIREVGFPWHRVGDLEKALRWCRRRRAALVDRPS